MDSQYAGGLGLWAPRQHKSKRGRSCSYSLPDNGERQVEYRYTWARGVAWHPTENLIAVGGVDADSVSVWRYDPATTALTMENVKSSTDIHGPRGVAWHPTENLIAVAGAAANSVSVWRYDPATTALTMENVKSSTDIRGARGVAWHPTENLIAVGGYHADSVSVWKTTSFPGRWISSWHDFSGTVCFDTLTSIATITGEDKIKVNVEVGGDGSAVKDNYLIDLDNGKNNYSVLGLVDNARYARFVVDMQSTNCSTPPELDYLELETSLVPPTLLEPENGAKVNDNTPTFSWENMGAIDNYEIWIDNDADFSSPEIKDNTIENSCTPTLSDENYWWRVREYKGSEVSNFSATWTILIDTTPPTISEVSASGITQTSANILWTTDEPADSTVDYGTTQSYGSTVSDTQPVTSHSLSLSGLSSNTTYHYRVKSVDAAGNESTSSDYTFTTKSPPPAPDFTIYVNPSSGSTLPGGSTTAYVLIYSVGGYSKSVSLTTSGQPSGVEVSFNPSTDTPYFESTMTVAVGTDAPSGSYEITITGSDDGKEHITIYTLAIQDFTISVKPEDARVERGGSITATVEVSSIGDYEKNVELSASSQPSGVNVSFNPSISVPPYSSTMTMKVGGNALMGTHTIFIVGTGAGGMEHSSGFGLTVILPPIHPFVVQEIKIREAGVNELFLTLRENVEGVSINVRRLEETPEKLLTPSGRVYSYLHFEIENLTEEDIENLTIKFGVDKSWVQQENIDPTTIRLNRYHDGEWQELPTSKIGENATVIQYSAESPGFSIFAITGEKVKPFPVKPFPWTIVVAVVIAIAVVVAVMSAWYFRRR